MTSPLLALLLVSASFSLAAQPVLTKTVQPNQRYGHRSPPTPPTTGGGGCSCYYGPPFPFFKPPFGPLPPNTPGGGGGGVFPPWFGPPFIMPPSVPPTGGSGCVGVPKCAGKNMTCPAKCYKYSPDGRSYTFACNYDCNACTITCA